jgi:pimeloyl-ACP methyl ester carboxylesterase
MPQVNANNITIEYDTFGEKSQPVLLLIMGLGAQMIHWDTVFCQKLADKGFFVIRYDNRDVGLSSKMEGAEVPDMASLIGDMMAGKTPKVPYSLDDMASDGVALMDVLGVTSAHICGASMGGMIAQLIACNHPGRALSLTSIMSTTGNPGLPSSTPEAQDALSAPRPTTEAEVAERAITNKSIIGSPGFDQDLDFTAKRAVEAFNRNTCPAGYARHIAAIISNGDRREKLQKLDLPTLVIHGKADPLVPVQGGQDTFDNIKGAKLKLIEGMGHDLPKGAWSEIIDAIFDIALPNAA